MIKQLWLRGKMMRKQDIQTGADGQGKAADDGDHLLLILVRHGGARPGLWIVDERSFLTHDVIRKCR